MGYRDNASRALEPTRDRGCDAGFRPAQPGQGFLGTSDSGTLTVGSITGGGEANVSLTVELEEFNAQGQGVGPPDITSAVSFFSYGTLSCENSEEGRTRGT
jgi:hypothetical protein